MLNLIPMINPKSIVEVKVYQNKKFIGYASMLEFGFIGGSEKVFDTLSEFVLKRIERRLMRLWVVKAGY